MSQSSFGKKFVVTTWGESHGKAIGAVLDGCPAGLSLCEEDIQVFLDRRKPGQSRYTTARKEGDLVEILSGVFEGKTTGTPISLLIMGGAFLANYMFQINAVYIILFCIALGCLQTWYQKRRTLS